MCIVVDRELLSEGGVCDDDDLKAGQDFGGKLPSLEDVNWDVSVQFTESVERGLVPWLANVAVTEEELGS